MVAMTFESLQPIVVMLLYLSDGFHCDTAAIMSTPPSTLSVVVGRGATTSSPATTTTTVAFTLPLANVPDGTSLATPPPTPPHTPSFVSATVPLPRNVGFAISMYPSSSSSSSAGIFHPQEHSGIGVDSNHYANKSKGHTSSSNSNSHGAGGMVDGGGIGSGGAGTAEAATTTISPDYGITNVTSQIGTNAYLPCKVKKIFNKSVSWVRVRDDHILTVDRVTFIADERFHAFHPTAPAAMSSTSAAIASSSATGSSAAAAAADSSDTWQLQIKYVQARDEGIYECQVSSEPKISARINLNVVVPRTEMIGDTSRYVKEGSKVSLHCIVTEAIEPPLYIIWYQGGSQIFPDNRRGWRTDINRESVEANPAHGTIGTLIIPSVKKRDSGNYTCSPSNSQPISTIIHVINGEYSASAITSTATVVASSPPSAAHLIAVLLMGALLQLSTT